MLHRIATRCFQTQRASFSVSAGARVSGDAKPAPDLSKARVGQRLEVPYEITVNNSWSTLWSSAFFDQNRINTSAPFAQSLGLADQIMPYSMMFFLTGSMSHVDETKEVLELATRNAVYLQPAYAGDTFRKVFHIRGLRAAKDGKATIVTIKCELFNQRDEKVFSLDKLMLYPVATNANTHIRPPESKPAPPESGLLRQVLEGVSQMAGSGSSASHSILKEKSLILHSMGRMIGKSMAWSLSTLFRMTHPSLYNSNLTGNMIVPGSLALASTLATSSSDLFEVLHEEVTETAFPNKMKPTDVISGMTFVKNIKQIDTSGSSALEEADVCTIGLKDFDIRNLNKVDLPVDLFSLGSSMKYSELEAFLKQQAPMLSGKIVCLAQRKLIRQSPSSSQIFLL